MTVVVEVGRERFTLGREAEFTFGRDPSVCTVALGVEPLDRGISRLAGSISHDRGIWWITNRSSSRSLHVIDVETGLGVPLPVARDNWPAARHIIDRQALTVLVRGEVLTHALSVSASANELPVAYQLPQLHDPVRTSSLLPHPTDKQREALVSMVEGYLQPFPRYKPEPRTYEEAASRLGLPASTVRRRIESIRASLVEGGVAGLDSGDARRNLAEWILSNRVITSGDFEWFRNHLYERDRSKE